MKAFRRSCFIVVIFLSPAILSCRKDPSLYRVKNLSGNKVNVFGHGGMGMMHRYPMNSSASLEECVSAGADGVEMDVRMSADDELFLFHDASLEAASGCNGSVEQTPGQSLSLCSYKGPGSHRLEKLRDFLVQHVSGDLLFALDCKMPDVFLTNGRMELFADSLGSLVGRLGLAARVKVESQYPWFLRLVKERSPGSETYLYCDDFQVALDVSATQPLDGITIDREKITPSQVYESQNAGLKVTLFNTRTEAQNLRALLMNPDNIQTDRVKHLVEVYVKRRELN